MPDMGYMKTECNSTKDPTYKKSPRTGGSIQYSSKWYSFDRDF